MMRRRHMPLVLLTLFVGLGLVTRSLGQGSQLLCSAGSKDGQACATNDDCPGGACVQALGVCTGGPDDGLDCDCSGGACNAAPACSNDPTAGTCSGGAFAGECCDVEFNCNGGTCQGTQKICLAGEFKGFPCTSDSQCPGSQCVSTGRVCVGDVMPFACVGDEDCVTGTCQGLAAPPTPTPSPTPTPTSTVSPCVGDCNGSGDVTVDKLVIMVNIALGSAPVANCTAGDANHDGEITVDEIVQAVNNALGSCPA